MDRPDRSYTEQRFSLSFDKFEDWLRTHDFLFYVRFHRLTDEQKDVVYFGVARHLYYCERLDFRPYFHDKDALREILEDAQKGKNVALLNHVDIEVTDYSIATLGGLGNFAGIFQEQKRDTMGKRKGGTGYVI